MYKNNLESQLSLENTLLLENIQGGILFSDVEPPYHLRYVTPGMVELSGYTQEELLNLVQMDIVHPDDIDTLLEDVCRQFAVGNTFEVTYRLLRKDGSFVHVLDRARIVTHDDGNKYIHCILTDITHLKELERSIRLSQEKYRIAMELSGSVIIEYIIDTGVMNVSENFDKVFPNKKVASDDIITVTDGLQLQKANPSLSQLFQNTAKLKKPTSIECQLDVNRGEDVWCNVHMTPVKSDSGAVYAIIACLQNIDKQKHELEALMDLSKRDPLTGVLNCSALEEYTNEQLANSEPDRYSALIIMDVDKFKYINDNFGHTTGDSILTSITSLTMSVIPDSALLGRLGGDEFLVFLGNQSSLEDINDIANAIVSIVGDKYKNSDTPVTVSLGVAISTPDIVSFKQLYKKADTALYETKGNGRNGYTLYNQTDIDQSI